nr:autotransporter outer membrane beta-barrel domain-containing protein [Rhodovulum imhoffii]
MNAGSAVTGEVLLGDGSDRFVFRGGDLSGLTLLDGGDDTSSADGFIDVITINAPVDLSAGAFDLSVFTNWELLEVDGVDLTVGSDDYTVGDGTPGTGFSLLNGANVTAGAASSFTGFFNVGTGSTFNASAGGISLNGAVTNAGTITLQDGAPGDVLTINGNFTGSGGTLSFDTVLGDDTSASDMIVVNGDFSGTSNIAVANIGGGGDVTSLGIKLVDVGGTLGGTQTLLGDYTTTDGRPAVIAGAYAYTLAESGGNLVLLSEEIPVPPPPPPPPPEPPVVPPEPPVVPPEPPSKPLYQPAAPVYELYLNNLYALARLPSYRTRLGAIRSSQNYSSLMNQNSNVPGPVEESPFWLRLSGSHIDHALDDSTTGAKGDIDRFMIEAGFDTQLSEMETGKLYGGVILSYGQASTDVRSRFGNGDIDTDAVGIGLTATYAGYDGFYADAQLRYSWFSTDLKSSRLGKLKNSRDGNGISASLELGQRIGLEDGLILTPQAQLMYTDVDFDTFTGPGGARVSAGDGDKMELRVGLTAEQQIGDTPGDVVYGLMNVYYNFDDSTEVRVSGVSLSNSTEDLSFEVGFGVDAKVGTNAHVFGEVAGSTSFDSDTSVRGNIGVRWSF